MPNAGFERDYKKHRVPGWSFEGKFKMKNIFDKISSNEALEILRLLADTDKQVKNKICKIAEEMITDVEFEGLSEDVFFALDGIDVHDLWNRSGSTVDGYISPGEMACEMIDDELEPFKKEIYRLVELDHFHEAKKYCMEVLKGIYMYNFDSQSEFKNWATDVPAEYFHEILNGWKKRTKKEADIKEMNDFLMKECENWVK